MRGHKYIVGDRVYRTEASPIIPKGTKGTVGPCHMSIKGYSVTQAYVDELVQVQFDNGHIWYCDIKFIKPLVRVVG